MSKHMMSCTWEEQTPPAGASAHGTFMNPTVNLSPHLSLHLPAQASLFDEAAADRVDALVQARASRPGLILCASLLENLPNLAGMCRCVDGLCL